MFAAAHIRNFTLGKKSIRITCNISKRLISASPTYKPKLAEVQHEPLTVMRTLRIRKLFDARHKPLLSEHIIFQLHIEQCALLRKHHEVRKVQVLFRAPPYAVHTVSQGRSQLAQVRIVGGVGCQHIDQP